MSEMAAGDLLHLARRSPQVKVIASTSVDRRLGMMRLTCTSQAHTNSTGCKTHVPHMSKSFPMGINYQNAQVKRGQTRSKEQRQRISRIFMTQCTEIDLQIPTCRNPAAGRWDCSQQNGEERIKGLGIGTSVCHTILLPLRPGHCNNENFASCVSVAMEGFTAPA
jgi:hypothetical protein